MMPLIRSSIAVGKGWFKPTREVILPPGKAPEVGEPAKKAGLGSLIVLRLGAAFYNILFGPRYRTIFSNLNLFYPIRRRSVALVVQGVLEKLPFRPTLVISLLITGNANKKGYARDLLMNLYVETRDVKYAHMANWVHELNVGVLRAECIKSLSEIPDYRLCHVLQVAHN